MTEKRLSADNKLRRALYRDEISAIRCNGGDS